LPIAQRQIDGENGETITSLSEDAEISQEDFDTYFDLWLKWIVSEKKLSMRELLDEPERIWNIVMKIDSRYQQLLSVMRNQQQEHGVENG
jgi:hypothetical protein